MYEGVRTYKPMISLFKTTLRALADQNEIGALSVEEALYLGITTSKDKFRAALASLNERILNRERGAITSYENTIFHRILKTKSFSRLFLKAIIAYKAISSPSGFLDTICLALIETEKKIQEIKEFTKSEFNLDEKNILKFYTENKLDLDLHDKITWTKFILLK